MTPQQRFEVIILASLLLWCLIFITVFSFLEFVA